MNITKYLGPVRPLKRYFTVSGKFFSESDNPTKLTHRTHRTRLTNLLWRDRYTIGNIGTQNEYKSKEKNSQNIPFVHTPKHMKDSYCEVILPFGSDLDIREEYVNFFRGLRLGKLMEDFDAMAGSIAYKHCSPKIVSNSNMEEFEDLPFLIVTASVDRIDLLNPLRPDLDMKIYGHVTYVGSSSMEVTIRVESKGNPNKSSQIDSTSDISEAWTPILICKFTMVAKDPKSGKAVKVAPLIVETEKEKSIFQLGQESKSRRIEEVKKDLSKQAPTMEESLLIHNIWNSQKEFEDEQGRIIPSHVPSNVRFMSDTTLNSVRLCQPQERNVHSSIFGGFLLRECFELAYTTARTFLNSPNIRPRTLTIDKVDFLQPVAIGTILHFSSMVVFSEGSPEHRTFQVVVSASEVTHEREEVNGLAANKKKNLTDLFCVTFVCDGNLDKGSIPHVLPRTYAESMKYLQARRRKESSLVLSAKQKETFEKFRHIDK